MRYGRIILAAVTSEVLAILSLVLAVALFGPADQGAAESFAQEVGAWLGPIAGFIFTALAAWFISRKLEAGRIQTGVAVGVATALIDLLLLIASGSGFRLLFALSNVGRVLAGYLGGWLASRGQEA